MRMIEALLSSPIPRPTTREPRPAATGELSAPRMGLLSSASIILIQEIVDWSERGSVTASFLFARNLGSTFGATIFGSVLNLGLMRSGVAGAVTSDELRRLLERGSEHPAGDAALRAALEQSLHLTFVAMFAVALLVAATASLVPKVVFAARRALAE